MNKEQIEKAIKELQDMPHSNLAQYYIVLLQNKLKEIENDRRQETRT